VGSVQRGDPVKDFEPRQEVGKHRLGERRVYHQQRQINQLAFRGLRRIDALPS
jgi:hypothetical protein